MRQLLADVLNFIFPAYCPVCGNIMWTRGVVICLECEVNMPRARYTDNPENPVAQLFWGRTRVEMATSLFRFEKGSKYQKLLHLLKYKGDKKIGLFLGKLLGAEIRETIFSHCDYIIPVPLHPKKLRKRGYNQSEIIALGVASVIDLPVRTDLLLRTRQTSTQTRKNRFERFKNVENVFCLNEKISKEEARSVLLIDDVVTTGSTLEACAEALLKFPGMKVYIATVACA